jgi:hypothetical protein
MGVTDDARFAQDPDVRSMLIFQSAKHSKLTHHPHLARKVA